MTLQRDKYFCIWRDIEGAQAATQVNALTQEAAVHVATKLAAASSAKLEHLFVVREVVQVATHEPEAGSNVRSKGWAFYKTAAGKQIKLSIPSFRENLLVTATRRFSTDILEGVGRLVTRAGNVATKFVTGRYNYGLRKRDKTV